MIIQVLKAFFAVFMVIAKVVCIPLIIVAIVFVVLIFANIGYEMAKGRRFKKGKYIRRIERNSIVKLLYDFPRQFTEDLFNKDPDFFKYQGCIIYEGRQGWGKTISMVHDAMMMQLEYPLSKCLSNLNYAYQDTSLDDWRQLIDFKNGKHGVIAMIDEMQNWFSSNQSKNFPPEMLEVITQNRKNRRVIMGTAQNFYLLSKAIRSQATEVRKCYTFFGCITFVHKVEPYLDSEGKVMEWKGRGWYFYVHDARLRESYDTYKVIESLAKSGFSERQQEINVTTNVISGK